MAKVNKGTSDQFTIEMEYSFDFVSVFYMHAITPRTVDPPAFELQVDSPAGNREIAYPQEPLIVAPPVPVSTVKTEGRFFRLLSWITRAYRSPHTPTNFDEALKPGKVKSARIDLRFFILLA